MEVNGNISSDTDYTSGLEAGDSSKVTVNGNVTVNADESAGVLAKGSSSVTVTGDVTVTGNVTNDWTNVVAVQAVESGNINVQGSVQASGDRYDGVKGQDNSIIHVGAGVSANGAHGDAVIASDSAQITITGDVKGGDGDPDAVDYSDPEDNSDGGYGIEADDSATVIVDGSVCGGDAYGTAGYGGHGIFAGGTASVTVTGDVTGGNLTADPAVRPTDKNNMGGEGIYMKSTATVHVKGDATGGSTNGANGSAGSGLYMEYVKGDQGSATVDGHVTGGNGAEYSNIGIFLGNYSSLSPSQLLEAKITVGSYTGLGSYRIDANTLNLLMTNTTEPMEDLFWQGVLQQLRGAKEGDTVTIDAGFRTHVPTQVLKTAQEKGITLVIQWKGGEDITVDASTTYDETRYSIPLSKLAK